jgi:hypothetical protein
MVLRRTARCLDDGKFIVPVEEDEDDDDVEVFLFPWEPLSILVLLS